MNLPNLLLTLLAALLGLAFGTLAAYIGEAALAHRKITMACPYCTAPYPPLQWSALVAVVTGHGRCAACNRFLRVPRLIGELFLAVTWGLLISHYGLTPRTLLACVALFPQAIILVTDLEAKLIPNRVMLPSLLGMVVIGTLLGPAVPPLASWNWWTTLAGAAIGFGTFRLLVWLGVALFGEGALGEGDITLAAYVGAVVGFPLIIESLLLAFVFGGIGAAIVLLLRRGKLGTAIPYGPFIILGCTTTLLYGAEILHWLAN
jgi:leader peptidase (prepilin peptidase) / N-methyltransferase